MESLFANMPLHETVIYLYNFISPSNISLPTLIDCLIKLIILCTPNIPLDLEFIAYRQFDSMAMGSSLGPELVDVFLSVTETKLIDCISILVLYKRFFEDILISNDPTNCVGNLHFLASTPSRLSFSHEEQTNGWHSI